MTELCVTIIFLVFQLLSSLLLSRASSVGITCASLAAGSSYLSDSVR